MHDSYIRRIEKFLDRSEALKNIERLFNQRFRKLLMEDDFIRGVP